jgi:hypothetical protein
LETITFGIEPWIRQQRARQPYICCQCGGIIPKRSWYQRYIIRHGRVAGKDPLSIRHAHLDCEAPWYQPDTTHHLRGIAALPRVRVINEASTGVRVPHHELVVEVSGERFGTLLWRIPTSLTLQLMESSDPVRLSALGELRNLLALTITVAMSAASKKRQALVVNHLLNELAATVLNTPPS